MLASRRDAPAGLIQWGDDPSLTRYGLRSSQCSEAHSFFGGCLRPPLLAALTAAVDVRRRLLPAETRRRVNVSARQLCGVKQAARAVRWRGRNSPSNDGLQKDHSITSSARTRIAGEMVTPMASAVFILRTNSNFVGCSTGRSATFAPFAIVSTNSAARRYMAGKTTP